MPKSPACEPCPPYCSSQRRKCPQLRYNQTKIRRALLSPTTAPPVPIRLDQCLIGQRDTSAPSPSAAPTMFSPATLPATISACWQTPPHACCASTTVVLVRGSHTWHVARARDSRSPARPPTDRCPAADHPSPLCCTPNATPVTRALQHRRTAAACDAHNSNAPYTVLASRSKSYPHVYQPRGLHASQS